MNQFSFESKQKSVLIGGMILGLVCLIATWWVGDDGHHTRFWSNFLHNSVFFTGIAFLALFINAAFVTALAGWYVVFKRIFEAYSLFLIPGLILMLVIIAGIWGHFHHLYHWADPAALLPNDEGYIDKVLAGKSGFLNKYWYTFGTLIIVGMWIFFALRLRKFSVDEDKSGTTDYAHYKKTRLWSAIFLPLAGFSSAAIVWQWVMSTDSHWYSTLFAWYSTISWFVAAFASIILLMIYLKSKGYYQNVTDEHMHDLGKYLFAFSVFWTYLWFSQYMLIWYSNNGEETIYFHMRRENYPVLFYGNLVLNFIVPFFVLMRNDTKRKYGTLALVAIVTFIGHWIDFFLMLKPGIRETAMHGHGEHVFALGFTIPGLLEIGIMIGFLSGFLYFVFSKLSQASLVPENDPYLGESLHHHV
jgi:hypothetical protein